MIEGQDGLNWPRWQRMAQAVEALGFDGLYRSDHYTNAEPPDKDSLELWISLSWLASNTRRIRFGPLVSPLSFRNPTMLARMARDVDDLSSGRLMLGLGAGWQQREHRNYGWSLLEVPDRFKRFEEGLEVISKLFGSTDPVEFQGTYFELHEAILLPRPGTPGGPPITVGGNGLMRTLPLAANYADEWNGVFLTPTEYALRNQRLDDLLHQHGRDPSQVRRSLMAGCVFGRDDLEVQRILDQRGKSRHELGDRGLLVGTASEIVDQLAAFDDAGVQSVMLQWLELDDLDRLEALAASILS